MANNETDDEAEVRRKRLQALRNKQVQKPDESPAGAGGRGELAKKFKARKQADASGDDGDRKRQMIKKLIQKRMQEGGGDGAAPKKKAGKGAIGALLKKKQGGKAGASGADLSKFPKLKAMLDKRRAQESGSVDEPVEKLEHRVKVLEDEVKKTQQQLKKSKLAAEPESTGDDDSGKKS